MSICPLGYHKIFWISCFNCGPANGLVNKSAKFSEVCTFVILSIPAATASLTRWYAMELCFFLSVDVGTVALVTTDLLSQNTLAGPSIGMPIILSLYLIASNISTRMRMATNSDPNVDDSIVLWDLEYHCIGEQFKYIMIPVCDRRVTLFPAWLASTNAFICTGCPLGSGALGGTDSLASW